jgi:hypothetical protein
MSFNREIPGPHPRDDASIEILRCKSVVFFPRRSETPPEKFLRIFSAPLSIAQGIDW